MNIEVDADRMLADLRRLADFGRVDLGVHRLALTAVDIEARQWLLQRMLEAGLQAEIDGIGNVVGRTRHRRRIIIGSHTDTVPKGGWLDGALGVIYGLEIARCVQSQDSELGIEVISFSDEEGHFDALLGSRAYCGTLDFASTLSRRTPDGVVLSDALREAGLAGNKLARLDSKCHVAFLEAHIEQGPVLEAQSVDIGIVTHIVGLREHHVGFTGEANHAGTTPMAMRKNASAALLQFGHRLDSACWSLKHPETVWNFARLRSDPLASNVVAAAASCVVQYRSTEDFMLDEIAAMIDREAAMAAARFNTEWTAQEVVRISPVSMAPSLITELDHAAGDSGVSSLRLPSGAGHDAMILAAHVPAAMLFVPSQRGISHNTSENTSDRHLRQGLRVLARAVERICELHTAVRPKI